MAETFTVELELEGDYEFEARFPGAGKVTLHMDEPEPVGGNTGPNAARVLAADVGNCLTASLLFCLRKAKVDVQGARTRVEGTLTRNEKGRLRVGGLKVDFAPQLGEGAESGLRRCRDLFEDFCVVTQAVRSGLPVDVEVEAA